MAPNADKHKFSITLQKDSSLVMEAYARLQINILLEPIDGFEFLKNVPKVFMPALWFEEYVELTPDLMQQLTYSFIMIPRYLSIAGLVLVLIGACLLAVPLIIQRFITESVPYSPLT